MSARIAVVVSSSGKRPETEDACGCGEIVEKCWECGLVLCTECAVIREIDGYRAVYCPMCAPFANEVSE